MQKTICETVSITGTGLHCGQKVRLQLSPAEIDSGINFFTDYSDIRRIVPYSLDAISGNFLFTSVGDDRCSIGTIEHLMSAFNGLGITNINVTLSGPEIPILDGSSLPFVNLIFASGIKEQDKNNNVKNIKSSFIFGDSDRFIKVSPCDELVINFYLESKHKMINGQKFEFILNQESYVKEIAPARTYCFESDIENMRKQNLIKGGSLENAVVFTKNSVLNNSGLRFKNEAVRHKILDFLGDIYCLGQLNAKFEIKNSGHQFTKKFIDCLISKLI